MNLVIIGSGGHAGVVIDAWRASTCLPIRELLDETLETRCSRHGYPAGKELQMQYADDAFFIAVGDNRVRERISNAKRNWANVFHPRAIFGGILCSGVYLGCRAVIGPNAIVGDFSIVNTGAILEHDSVLGAYSHLCPGVITGGGVKIGNLTTVGMGAIIRDHVTIGNNCVIGMGSVVTKDIPDNSVAYGNPCRVIRTV